MGLMPIRYDDYMLSLISDFGWFFCGTERRVKFRAKMGARFGGAFFYFR